MGKTVPENHFVNRIRSPIIMKWLILEIPRNLGTLGKWPTIKCFIGLTYKTAKMTINGYI